MMKFNRLNSVIVLGLIAIAGILAVQLVWTKYAFNSEIKKFEQKVQISLLQVLNRLYEINRSELPFKNPVNKVSSDYYIVNVNDDFDADVLEYCLKTEFQKSNLITDFEYAIYKCESDEMVYGNYVSFVDSIRRETSFHFPKQKGLVYYFAIRFPNETTYLLGSLTFWIVLSAALIVILIIYVYSIFTILQQKKYSELQKDFINNMTHEFKTPLSSILIASNYLIKQEKINSDDKLEKYTDIIIQQSNKLNSHIEKILNTAKSDHNSLHLEKKRVDVVTLIRNIIENMSLKHSQLNVVLQSESDPTFILADEFHFSNVVYNLIDNSIKYCEGAPDIQIKIANGVSKVKIEFTDNGIGISPKNISYIFDKFYRIQNNRSNEVTGFGLGLYYVKKICLLHKWKIDAFNNLSNGITVSLLIPNMHEPG